MTAIVKQRRILLKEWFVAEDSRREEVVTQVGGSEKPPVPVSYTQESHRDTPHDTMTLYTSSPDPIKRKHLRGEPDNADYNLPPRSRN